MDEEMLREDWHLQSTEDIIEEIVKVVEEKYPEDPMPRESIIHAALVAGKDKVIEAIKNGIIHP